MFLNEMLLRWKRYALKCVFFKENSYLRVLSCMNQQSSLKQHLIKLWFLYTVSKYVKCKIIKYHKKENFFLFVKISLTPEPLKFSIRPGMVLGQFNATLRHIPLEDKGASTIIFE